MEQIKRFLSDFGLPRIIIAVFLLALFMMAPAVGVNVPDALKDVFNRFGMNGILVLALIPMIQAGCGLNFGLPLGIIAGLLGATISIEMGYVGAYGFFFAILTALSFGSFFGLAYGALLNRVKGGEMMIATYVGLSSVMLMQIGWLALPYKSAVMIYGFSGEGLRPTISVDGFWRNILDNFMSIKIYDIFDNMVVTISDFWAYIPGIKWYGKIPGNDIGKWLYEPKLIFAFPTGTILLFLFVALIVWAFFHMKTGTAMTAVGSNPIYARAAGINVNRMRTISVMLSTMLGAMGIIVYQQSFGFIQLYDGPLYMAFPAIAAILIGGARVNKASLPNVFTGVILYQGILVMTPLIFNAMLKLDMSDVIRIIVSQGMILYALTRKTKVLK
ncbi:MAG: ABC transporter permease [Synergistaceae bacterium]|nr:ABC transporter permease [Synergistaceae bacterium]